LTTFFFKKASVNNHADFRKYYTLQNLEAIKNASVIFFILNFSFRLFYWVFPHSLNQSPHFTEYNVSNWAYLGITPIFFIIGNQLIAAYKRRAVVTAIMRIYSVSFALYIILCGMAGSYIAMHNLHNTLTLFLVALLTMSIICVLEYAEALFITLITAVTFLVLILCFTRDPVQQVGNLLVCSILLTGYYFITRFVYDYKAKHYQQLTEIKSKNIEIEKASLFKTEVLGMVAHDLRNPISAIESLTMIMELNELDEDMQDNIHMIKASCIKARTIINDLLDVARKIWTTKPWQVQP
jgi:two-component system sensor histidine kinase VicK